MSSKAPSSGEFDEIISRLRSIQTDVIGKGNGADKPTPIPLIDPTANVQRELAAEKSRQDDLRAANDRRIDDLRKQQMAYEGIIQKVREKAQQDLSAAESKRIDAINLAETRRLDAVLAEQKSAVALASEKTAAQAAALATQVLASAEALRAQVAATSATTTQQTTQLRDSLEKRLQTVEQNQYQGVGAGTQRIESRQTSQWLIGLIVGVVFTGLISIVGTILIIFWKH
jgi:tetrahydromethanopterin S-methyltransferase subunit F